MERRHGCDPKPSRASLLHCGRKLAHFTAFCTSIDDDCAPTVDVESTRDSKTPSSRFIIAPIHFVLRPIICQGGLTESLSWVWCVATALINGEATSRVGSGWLTSIPTAMTTRSMSRCWDRATHLKLYPSITYIVGPLRPSRNLRAPSSTRRA